MRAFLRITTIAIFFIITLLSISHLWIINNYNNDINIDVIIFHIRFPLVGANSTFIYSYLLYALLPSILFTILFIFKRRLALLLASIFSIVIFLSTEILKQMSVIAYSINETLAKMIFTHIQAMYYKSFLYNNDFGIMYLLLIFIIIKLTILFYKWIDRIRFRLLNTIMLCFIICINLVTINLSFNLVSLLSPKPYTSFYDTFYTIPEITLPKKQTKNLIVLFVESMQIYDDATPNLKNLSSKHINFSNTSSYGGLIQIGHTSWTIAGMVGYMCGIPLNTPSSINVEHFLSNATCISDVLDTLGYTQAMLMGSDDSFVAKGAFLKSHKIKSLDMKYFKDIGKLPQDYKQGWGFEDSKLFAFARDELESLSKQDKPFALYMLTNNTHYPDSYIEKECDNINHSYKEAVSCDDKLISEFIAWIQKQEFYKNTTIVILGDHLPMSFSLKTQIYNTFINPSFSTKPLNSLVKNRNLAHFDIAPLLLDSIGFRVEEFGLGRNPLYFQSLLEKYEKEQITNLVSSNSKVYESFWNIQ